MMRNLGYGHLHVLFKEQWDCISSSSAAVIKRHHKKQLKEESVYLAYDSREIGSMIVGKAWNSRRKQRDHLLSSHRKYVRKNRKWI